MGQVPVREIHEKDLISVIVPVLNEETSLPSCLEAVKSQEEPFEIIVVDGGSTDATCDVAGKLGARVIRSEPGRWRQLNNGAGQANGDIFLFLHADSILFPGALEKIRDRVSKGLDGGAFTLRFEPSSFALAFAVFWANALVWVNREFQGDRGIFVKREVFEKLNGFRQMDLMEDLDFSWRMRRAGNNTRQLIGPVTTSSRRFEGMRWWPVTYWTVRLLIEYHLGHDLDKVSKEFYAARKR